MDTNRVTQRDPDDSLDAHYSGLERLNRPHGCIDGVVYIGHVQYEDEHGEEVEVFDAVPCKRCKQAAERR